MVYVLIDIIRVKPNNPLNFKKLDRVEFILGPKFEWIV